MKTKVITWSNGSKTITISKALQLDLESQGLWFRDENGWYSQVQYGLHSGHSTYDSINEMRQDDSIRVM